MRRIIFATFGLVLSGAATDAAACTVYHPYDPYYTLKFMSVAQIVDSPDIIVQGIVIKPDHLDEDASSATATMVVDRVWKGSSKRLIIVRFSVRSSDCTHPPPFGMPIRIFASTRPNGEVPYDNRFSDLPLDDSDLNRALAGHEGKLED